MKMLILGAGGHGRVIAELLRLQNQWTLIGFLDDHASGTVDSLPVLGGMNALQTMREGKGATHVALGVGDNARRLEWGRSAVAAGFVLSALIHPQAMISPTATLADGVVVLAGAVVGVGAVVGDFGIINTRASVDHHCVLGEAVHVAPGATLTGKVKVGGRALVGAGSVILPGLEVGSGAVVGAGAVVTRNVAAGAVVVGVPAGPLRQPRSE